MKTVVVCLLGLILLVLLLNSGIGLLAIGGCAMKNYIEEVDKKEKAEVANRHKSLSSVIKIAAEVADAIDGSLAGTEIQEREKRRFNQFMIKWEAGSTGDMQVSYSETVLKELMNAYVGKVKSKNSTVRDWIASGEARPCVFQDVKAQEFQLVDAYSFGGNGVGILYTRLGSEYSGYIILSKTGGTWKVDKTFGQFNRVQLLNVKNKGYGDGPNHMEWLSKQRM
ncbi:MAG: hypothetical protein FWG50_10665 [Kiritimatiellaeota bacterium]|nr:hypothetical protein [Kiritimatiellota bacterium]